MIQRLLLYIAVVLVIVVAATTFNRFVMDQKKTVDEVLVETTDYFKSNSIVQNKETSGEERSLATSEEAVDAKFKVWFQDETRLVSSTSLDLQEKETELRTKAQSMTSQQISFLKQKVTDATASQDEKILSTYLLSLAGEAAASSLSEVASQPLKIEPAEPHSVQELKNNQERAKAIMAIDAIAESDRSLSLRIDELRKIINSQSDITVKNYAQRKQSELQSEL